MHFPMPEMPSLLPPLAESNWMETPFGRIGHCIFLFTKSGILKFWEGSLLSVFLFLVFMTMLIFLTIYLMCLPMSPHDSRDRVCPAPAVPSTAPSTQCTVAKSLLNAKKKNLQHADEANWLNFGAMGNIWSPSFKKYLVLEKPLVGHFLFLALFLWLSSLY